MVRTMPNLLITADEAPLDRPAYSYDEAALCIAVDTWAAATSDPEFRRASLMYVETRPGLCWRSLIMPASTLP